MADFDSITYNRADGKSIRFVPRDQRTGVPVNRDIVGHVYLDRTGAAKTLADCGDWVPEGDPSILKPAPVVVKPTPVPTPTPAKPTPTLKVMAAVEGASGDGIDLSRLTPDADGVIRVLDTRVSGYNQNVVWPWGPGQAIPKRRVELKNLRSLDAYRDDPSGVFNGNGLWVAPGLDVLIDGCLLDANGWQDGRPPNNSTMYRHNVYAFWGSNVVAKKSIFANASGCGMQTKGSGGAEDCVFIRNGIGYQGLQGPAYGKRCLTYDGRTYSATELGTGRITAWSGDIGYSMYCPFSGEDLCVAGGPRQGVILAPPTTGKVTHGAAFTGSRSYDGNVDAPGKAPVGAAWSLNRWAVDGWMGGTKGGDSPPVANPDVQWKLPDGAGPKLDKLLAAARTTSQPVADIVDEMMAVAKVPWAK